MLSKQENKIEIQKGIFYTVPESTIEKPIETIFTNYAPKDQYWRRQKDFPKFFYDYNPHLADKKKCRINASRTEYRFGKLVTLSVEDTIELDRLVQREVTRMLNGIFIMNNGVRIYFPGDYYGALQWGKMFGVSDNDGYGEHRRCQRRYACTRQLALDEDILDGFYCHKIKKSGITQLESLFECVRSIVRTQFTAAMMSKNHDTAKKANFKYYLYALKNIPDVLRPTIEQRTWSNAAQKIEIRSENADLSYENTIAAVATTTDGLDGLPPIEIIHLDEPPKMDHVESIYTKSKEQARIQQTKVGIIIMTSYPPEDDTQSFFWCKDFYKQCEKLGEDGWPVNKMLACYIGIDESTNGTFDIYGEPDRIKAYQMEQAKRPDTLNAQQLQARKRQYHGSAKEGWESGGGGTIYNNIILGECEAILEEQYLYNQLNYVEGFLEWTGAPFNSPVRFVQLTSEQIMSGKVVGKWKIYCSLEYMERNTNLCFKMPKKPKFIHGEQKLLLQPHDCILHASGTDPVDYAYVSQLTSKQSKNASVVKDIEGNLLSVYHFRDEDPDIALEDFCMEMIFWGLRALVEGNRKNAVTTLQNLGMYYFMLIRHPNGEIVPYGQGMAIKHISSAKDLKAKYIGLVSKKIRNNREQLKSLEIIRQQKEFDPIHTQEYDLAVADGLSEVAVEAVQTWQLSKKNKAKGNDGIGIALRALTG